MKKQFVLGLGMLAIMLTPLKGIAGITTENQLKTVYIYNFMRFVQWPENKIQQPTRQVCIYPSNHFGELLLQLEQRKIADKKIKVKVLSRLAEIKSCHVVFLNSISKAKLIKVVAIAEKHHVLTISDQHQFTNKGGMIQLFVKQGKIHFNINYYRSQLAMIEINSKILSLAAHVVRDGS